MRSVKTPGISAMHWFEQTKGFIGEVCAEAEAHNKAIEIGFAVDNTLSVHIVEKPFLRLVGQGVGQQIFVLHQNFHLLLHRLVFFCTACLRINISVVKFFYKPWHK